MIDHENFNRFRPLLRTTLQETKTVARPQVTVPLVSHPENSGCLITTFVFESNRHLTIERGTVNTAPVQSDLHELSAKAAESEKSVKYIGYQ